MFRRVYFVTAVILAGIASFFVLGIVLSYAQDASEAPAQPMQANAVPPGFVNYQGELLDAHGAPPAPGSAFTIRVDLYETATGGTAQWSEVHHNVQTDNNGRFECE